MIPNCRGHSHQRGPSGPRLDGYHHGRREGRTSSPDTSCSSFFFPVELREAKVPKEKELCEAKKRNRTRRTESVRRLFLFFKVARTDAQQISAVCPNLSKIPSLQIPAVCPNLSKIPKNGNHSQSFPLCRRHTDTAVVSRGGPLGRRGPRNIAGRKNIPQYVRGRSWTLSKIPILQTQSLYQRDTAHVLVCCGVFSVLYSSLLEYIHRP